MKKTIRDTVKESLAALSELQTVKVGRRHRLDAAQLPAALIYTDKEQIALITFSPKQYRHTVELIIRIYVKPDTLTAGEDKADELVALVDPLIQTAVAAIPSLLDIQIESVDFDADGTADADYLMAAITYRVEYITS